MCEWKSVCVSFTCNSSGGRREEVGVLLVSDGLNCEVAFFDLEETRVGTGDEVGECEALGWILLEHATNEGAEFG